MRVHARLPKQCKRTLDSPECNPAKRGRVKEKEKRKRVVGGEELTSKETSLLSR